VGPKCCDKINSIAENQCLDANGNQVNIKEQHENDECDCEREEIDSRQKDSTLSESSSIHQIDENIVKKLQTITLSDFGEFPSHLLIIFTLCCRLSVNLIFYCFSLEQT
jgi:hypothetical protein